MGTETVLETDRLRLTNWAPEHIDDVMRLHGDPVVTRYLTTRGRPETRADAERRLEEWSAQFAEHRMGKLRVERINDGALIGRAGFGFYPPTGEPEIGFALFRAHWGQGYATEAAEGLRDWFFAETGGSHFIGLAHVDNARSLAVLRRIGMTDTHVAAFEGVDCQFLRLDRNKA